MLQRFIVPAFCKILFCFASRLHRAQNNNSTRYYGEGLMGRMLKLMGNASPTRQEAFLTLMERGMRRGEVGGRARFTDSQTPAELQWSSLPPWNFSHPSCLPSFFPFTALQHRSQAFAFLLSAPPRPPQNTLTDWPLTPPPGLSLFRYQTLLTHSFLPPSPHAFSLSQLWV